MIKRVYQKNPFSRHEPILHLFIQKDIMPYLSDYFYSDPFIMVILKFFSGLFASFGYYLAPTALLIYGIVSSNLFKDNWKRMH